MESSSSGQNKAFNTRSQKSVNAMNADDYESNKGKIINPSLERCELTFEQGLREVPLKE